MASAAFLKLLCVGLVGMLVLSPHAEAQISCATVSGNLGPCIGYVMGGQLSPGCCPGVKRLNSLAFNTANRRSICYCLKPMLASYSKYLGRAKALLGICRVGVPYPLNPSVDCSRVT